jgi:hypothetical protein
VTQYSLVEAYRDFRGICLKLQESKQSASRVCSSETSLNFYETSRQHIAEDSIFKCLKGACEMYFLSRKVLF